MDALIVQPDPGLVLGELEDRHAEVAVGQNHGARARRGIGILRIEAMAGDFAETECLLVEISGLAGMVACNGDVPDLRHDASSSAKRRERGPKCLKATAADQAPAIMRQSWLQRAARGRASWGLGAFFEPLGGHVMIWGVPADTFTLIHTALSLVALAA